MKKIVTILAAAILFSTAPCQKVSAQQSTGLYDFESHTPQGFVQWVNQNPPYLMERFHKQYVNTYKKQQNYILAPKMQGAMSDAVKWGTKNTSINYWFSGNQLYWTIFVYPIKIIKNTFYYSDNIVDLVKKKAQITSLNQIEHYSGKDMITGESYVTKISYKAKKLQLGDKSTVDCVQEISRTESGNQTKEEIYLHFFKENMYFYVIVNGYTDNKEKNVIQAMRKCTFQKYYTNPHLEPGKKKNKVSRKNAILYATLYNPSRKLCTELKFYLYDKNSKKHKAVYRQNVKKKFRRRRRTAIRLDVGQCLKTAKRQMNARKAFSLKRKKKYKYKIQVKVGGKYYTVLGSFRIR